MLTNLVYPEVLNSREKLVYIGMGLIVVFYGFADLATYLGLILMLIGWGRMIKHRGFKKITATPLTNELAIFLSVALLSFINITDINLALSIFGNVLEIFIPFFITYILLKNRTEKFHLSLLLMLLTGSLIIGLVGIYQAQYLKMPRIESLLNNANILGAYALLVLPLSLSLFFIKDYRFKVMSVFFILLNGFSLVFSLSRSAILGIVSSMALIGLIKGKKILILILIAILLLTFVMPDSLKARVGGTLEKFTGGKSQRIYIWKNAWEMFKAHPILGVGIGQYGAHYQIYEESTVQDRKFDHAHNIFLQIIAELGLAGLLAFLLFLIKFLRYSIGNLPLSNNFIGILAVTLFSSLLGFLAQEQFEFSLIDAGGTTLLVGVLLGWFVALLDSDNKNNKLSL